MSLFFVNHKIINDVDGFFYITPKLFLGFQTISHYLCLNTSILANRDSFSCIQNSSAIANHFRFVNRDSFLDILEIPKFVSCLRLGKNRRSFHACGVVNFDVQAGSSRIGILTQPEALTETPSVPVAFSQTLGNKVYEFSNHLGNILTTFSDRKIAIESLSDQGYVAHYTAEILSSTDYYPFGFQMPGRVYEGGYRYGFNGKEQDPETYGTGNIYDYGFRIYNPRIGKFLSVDPLAQIFPFLSTYQFASNTPISAIDLDGLESKIVIYQENSKGETVLVSNTEYNIRKELMPIAVGQPGGSAFVDVDDKGPLGAGVYTITTSADGKTFTEKWEPEQGNSVNPFILSGVSIQRWTDASMADAKKRFENRLTARLIEKMAEDVIFQELIAKSTVQLSKEEKIALEKQVQNDVAVLESDDPKFKAKFATFASEEVASEYTKDWPISKTKPSTNHESNESKESEYRKTGIAIKFYDGAKSENIPNQLGFVKVNSLAHKAEAARALVNHSVNIGAENATEVKREQEKGNKTIN